MQARERMGMARLLTLNPNALTKMSASGLIGRGESSGVGTTSFRL